VRRALLTVLPKLLLSRTTGLLTRIPVPGFLRPTAFRWFANRYGADLGEIDGELSDYATLAAFFGRRLRAGARPIADAPIVWPCDGKIVTSGPLTGDRLEQIKGQTYTLGELLADEGLAEALAGGSQATIYLAPKDYHRVHVPFDAEHVGTTRVPGTYFPVNPGAVESIPSLFVRNERVVFRFRLDNGRQAAVIMVAALNVGDIQSSCTPGAMKRGDELGRFGFGSTTILVLPAGIPRLAETAPETIVRMGQAAPLEAGP